jgi:hypothetical protein
MGIKMTKKIIKILTFISIFAFMSTVFALSIEPAKAAEQITIVNHQGFLDSTGYFNVYGEVKNTGDTAAKNVYVKISFTSSEGVDEDEHDTLIRTILPGRKAPFAGTAGVAGSQITSYKVELMDLTMATEELPKVLEIVSAQSEVNFINNMMITGSVKNNGAEPATYTRVYGTVYDGPSGTGNVVAVTSTTAQPYNIDPGQTGNFEMGFFVTSGKSYASMLIVAESDQYEATSEYTVAISQSSTTTAAPTSLTSTNSPSPSGISPSPSIPEFPTSIAIAFLVVAMLMVSIVVKKNSAKLSFIS